MSIGYEGFACLIEQDEEHFLYSYGCSNWNDEKYMNRERIMDGFIMINKNCLVEPEIHRKLKRFPNGRKRMVEKRIPVEVPYEMLFESGAISVDNSVNCWRVTDREIDCIALRLIWKMFNDYQLTGVLPEKVYYMV